MHTEFFLRIASADDDIARLVCLLQMQIPEFSGPPATLSTGPRGHRLHEVRFSTLIPAAPTEVQIQHWLKSLHLRQSQVTIKLAHLTP